MADAGSLVRHKLLWLIIFVSLVASSLFLSSDFLEIPYYHRQSSEVLVGVDVAFDNVTEIKLLVDEISLYTNLIVVGSTGITYNVTKLDDVCQYVVDKGLRFMIYMHPQNTTAGVIIQRQWVTDAKARWRESFLGLYAFDEPGGRQLDNSTYRVSNETATNFTDASNKFTGTLSNFFLQHAIKEIIDRDLPLFTSDYALYWFDYKAGYDTIFAEFGWNYSRQLNVALCRGAASVLGKEWGVMITWTYTQPPFLESGKRLYYDLVFAYENGAKYILVFDTNENYTHGTMKEEHLAALRDFWEYAKDNPRTASQIDERVAYVLPKDFGYGFRGPNDKIWGQWEADDLSFKISIELGSLIEKYRSNMDIIYDDELDVKNLKHYSELVFWNGTDYRP